SVRGFCVRGRRAAGGEGDDEYRSAALRERGLQPATMQLDDLVADVQPQPEAASGPSVLGGLVEPVKDVLAVLRRDTHPKVTYRQLDLVRTGLGDLDFDRAALRAVFDGVVDQVGHHLLHAQWIHVGRHWPAAANG